jgi:hypothetical protein
MKGRKPPKAAAIEAFEEAGVVGRIGRRTIGRFRHRKRIGSRKLQCAVEIFPLAVHREINRWPEQAERKRRWSAERRLCGASKPRGCGVRSIKLPWPNALEGFVDLPCCLCRSEAGACCLSLQSPFCLWSIDRP